MDLGPNEESTICWKLAENGGISEYQHMDIDGTNEHNKRLEESETAQHQTERFLGGQPARVTEASNLMAIPSVALPTNGIPRSVFYIIGNEFCERFSYYGMKAILAIYLVGALGFTENSSTIIVHSFNFFAYFFSLGGGLLADNWLGKYLTIFYLSIVYVIGIFTVALSSIQIKASSNQKWLAVGGLGLLAVGTGGIKPCVSSFGGDQFDSFDVEKIASFFSVFYFTVNAGSVLSMLITPILRKNVHCFGEESCYPLAFALPSLLMLIALGIFVAGKKLYRHVPPSQHSTLLQIWQVYSVARRERHLAEDKSKPLLDYAKDSFSVELIESIRGLVRVIVCLLPAPLFWTLFDQQASKWTFQATQMNSNVFGWQIKPEQMQLLNAVLVLCGIPIFERIIYPIGRNFNFFRTSVQKIASGMFCGVVSFMIAAALQWKIDGGIFLTEEKNNIQTCIGNCVGIMWQTPQYIMISAGEIMFSITGLEFAYSQAPTTMKSFCQSFWLMTVAIGNLVVIVVTGINLFGRLQLKHAEVFNYLFYSCLLFGGLLFVIKISTGYHEEREYVLLQGEI